MLIFLITRSAFKRETGISGPGIKDLYFHILIMASDTLNKIEVDNIAFMASEKSFISLSSDSAALRVPRTVVFTGRSPFIVTTVT